MKGKARMAREGIQKDRNKITSRARQTNIYMLAFHGLRHGVTMTRVKESGRGKEGLKRGWREKLKEYDHRETATDTGAFLMLWNDPIKMELNRFW